ncbi:hypothetical protein N5D48_22545 [Pseudomonas sp. GD03858]|uniref:hypothetical protein n=1 Tax=unclassified Pseudomonas TaxID=196821 RepID=UPI00244A8192|nr:MULTISPECIES: hypothetical protein [unclassified Pseudomonas]MDH0649439.1 hypothetical protein [Pseudomonas sp. GD03867]MDH0665193.1 hypothetical protein [Pseudomonas sp. GD03858]
MKRLIPGIALLVGVLAISGQASAHGGGWYGPGPVIGAAVVGAVVGAAVSGGHDRTVYVQPQPVYAPPPVYVQAPPPPVYYQPYVVERYVPAPPPMYRRYYGPPPVYYGPPRW